ncbi:MAG TPA: hypothetical protein VGE52_04445 [Pirellulales bacterium]
MSQTEPTYFEELSSSLVDGWNRFWFTAVDPCVTGFLRLLTGGLLLWVLSTYTVDDLVLLWGPEGFQANDAVDSMNDLRTRPSFWRLTNNPSDFAPLHYVSLAVVALYAAGLFSRVTSVAATIVAFSYFHRSPQLTNELEPILSLLLVYLCIAPSGAAFSLDAWFRGKKNEPATLSYSAAIAVRLIQLHIAAAMLMSALGKLQGDVWWNGSAVWYLLARTETRGVDLTWLHGYLFTIIEIWTTFILWYQSAFAIFIWHRLARPLLLTLSVPVWFLVGLATNQWEFAAAFAIGTFAFLNPAWLRATTRRIVGESLAEKLCPPVESAPVEAGYSRSPSVRRPDAVGRREAVGANG